MEAAVGEMRAARLRLSGYGAAIYGVCVAAGIASWLPAIRMPLWIDETWLYWSVAAGWGQIPLRQDGLSFPAYSYILWLATKVLGTSEAAMRAPSVLAMLGAAWLLYLAAREMFARDVAAVAVVVFCLHPVTVFSATDVGHYAFAVLMTNAAILLALRLRRSKGMGTAAGLGLAAAVAVWFHFLFAVIVPALVVCIFAARGVDAKTRWRQFGVAAGAFAVGFLPVIPGVLGMFRTRGEHVYMPPPNWGDLMVTVTPGLGGLAVFVAGVVGVIVMARLRATHYGTAAREGWAWREGLMCAALGLIPLLTLFGVSVLTRLHISAPPWHLLVAVPGIALCWAWLANGLRRGWLRVVFCVLVAAAGMWLAMTRPMSKEMPRPKAAIEYAEKVAAPEHIAVIVCSDFVESNFAPMPVGDVTQSRFFAPLAYYRLTAPVVPLPKALNAEAMRIGGDFVKQAAAKHERFLAMGHEPSYPTLDWLAKQAGGAFTVRVLGVFSDVKVLEFTPRAGERD
ncbi:MAG TPA: glycosyltransferase family 39 protein [Terracidiphilus sp.]|nr:glycosyltransferase family 39 protein [Terracidiphilus sp.]